MKTYLTLTPLDIARIGERLARSSTRELSIKWSQMLAEIPPDTNVDIIGPDPEEIDEPEEEERWDGQE